MRIERNSHRFPTALPTPLRPGGALDAPWRQSRPATPQRPVEPGPGRYNHDAERQNGWNAPPVRTTGTIASSAWIAQLLAQDGAAALPADASAPACAAGAYRKTQDLTVVILGPHAADATPLDLRV